MRMLAFSTVDSDAVHANAPSANAMDADTAGVNAVRTSAWFRMLCCP